MFNKKPDSTPVYLRPLSFETLSILYDSMAGLLAFYASLFLQPSDSFQDMSRAFLFKFAFIYALTVLGVGLFLHTHREAWGKASVTFISRLIFKLLVVTALYYPLMHLLSQGKALPWPLPIQTMLLLGALIGLPRFIQRLRERANLPRVLGYERQAKLPVLVIGADHAAHKLVERATDSLPHYTLMGAISISSSVNIQDILGVPVLGALEKLESILENLLIEDGLPKRLILAEQFLMPQQIKHVLQIATVFHLPVLVNNYPRLEHEPLSLRRLTLEDLIQYGSRAQDNYEMKGYIRRKKILITSACEFLMQELASLIAEFEPTVLLLEDSFATGLAELQTKLLMLYPKVKVACFGRHSFKTYWSDLISQEQPDLIFYSTLATHAVHDESHALREIERLCTFGTAIIELKVPKVVIISQAYLDKEGALINLVDKFVVEYAQFINCGQSKSRLISIQLESNLLLQEQLLKGFISQQQQGNVLRVPTLPHACYFALKKEVIKLVLEVTIGENENDSPHPKAFVIDQVNPTYLTPLLEQAVLATGLIPYIDVDLEQFDAPPSWQFNGGFHQGLQLKSVSTPSAFEWLADFLTLCGQGNFSAASHLFKASYGALPCNAQAA